MRTHFELYSELAKGWGKSLRESEQRGGSLGWQSLETILGFVNEGVKESIEKNPYNYQELRRAPIFSVLEETLAPRVGDRLTTALLNVAYQVACHDKAGRRVYEVSPGLGLRLANTELRGVQKRDLRLPYENVYFSVPKTAGLKGLDGETVTAVYVTEESIGPERTWYCMMLSDTTEKVIDTPVGFLEINLNPDSTETIYEALDAAPYRPDSGLEEYKAAWRSVFSWVMNAVLYATWEEPGENWEANPEAAKLWRRIQKLPKGKKRARLQKQLNSTPRMRRIRLGAHIIDRAKAKTETPTDVSEGKESPVLRIRTRVAGHWRRQAYGPKHLLRRYQWIQPYWKNKEGLRSRNSPRHVMQHANQ